MDWFLYANGLRHERVERINHLLFPLKLSENLWFYDVFQREQKLIRLLLEAKFADDP